MLLDSPALVAWKDQVAHGLDTAPPSRLYTFGALVTRDLSPEQRAQRQVSFILSTADVDRDHDSITVAGWETKDYQKNPVVLWAHCYREPPIARAVQLGLSPTALTAVDEFPAEGVYPFADTIYALITNGYLNTVSVGFQPLSWVYDEERGGINYVTQTLLEHSIVPVPSNPYALIQAREAGIDTAPLRTWAVRTLDTLGDEPGLWLPRAKAEQLLRLFDPAKTISLPSITLGMGNASSTPALLPAVLRAQHIPTGRFAKLITLLKQGAPDVPTALSLLDEAMEDVMDLVSNGTDIMDDLRDARAALEGEPITPDDDDAGEADAGIPVVEMTTGPGVGKGVSPSDVSRDKAPEDTAWSAPTLSDFTDGSWGDLSSDVKRHIAGHFAWADTMPPSTYGDCKLPHHLPGNGHIVWRAVANAAARLPQASIPAGDVGAVQAHLARHYRAFGKVPPWEANALAWHEFLSVAAQATAYPTDLVLLTRHAELVAQLFPPDDASDDELLSIELEDGEEDVELSLEDDDAPPQTLEDLQRQLQGSLFTALTGRLPD